MKQQVFDTFTTPLDRNRLYCEDCLSALEKLKKENIKVDLIYLDPPFNSNRVYNMIFRRRGVTAQQKAFDDTWFTRTKTQQLVFEFENILETANVDKTTKLFLRAWLTPLKEQSTSTDRKLISYIIYMVERLIMMKEILSDKGSIYFHCDPTASHYIKIIMDGVFDRKNFVNEIVWCYRTGGASKKQWAKKHDVLLMYKNSSTHYFNSPKERSYLSGQMKHKKDKEILRDKYGNYQTIIYSNTEIKLYKNECGLNNEHCKCYYTMVNGRDYWEIDTVGKNSKEGLGYPTQKPLKLLERIIKASCPPNGTVLDPFCGCGTTIEAAVQNNVNWIGIDISKYAIDIIKQRLSDRKSIGDDQYDTIIDNPETLEEYKRMNAYQKQEFAIKAIGGMPNQRKAGDGGVDGEMTIHLGFTDTGQDTWGKMVFSVKSGKQHSPAHVRELIGTMKNGNFAMGGLIIDCDPTPGMEDTAEKAGTIEYHHGLKKDMPPDIYSRVQILTIDDIINRKQLFDTPPTLMKVKAYRDTTGKLQW